MQSGLSCEDLKSSIDNRTPVNCERTPYLGSTAVNQFNAYGGKIFIDPNLKPQSIDEITAQIEYEVLPGLRASLSYTHRYLNRIIEDLSIDGGNTYFIANPGFGIAKNFPRPCGITMR